MNGTDSDNEPTLDASRAASIPSALPSDRPTPCSEIG